MKTTIKDHTLHIEIPLQRPRPSSTGKTLAVATTRGNRSTEARIDGRTVIVGLNAYVRPTDPAIPANPIAPAP